LLNGLYARHKEDWEQTRFIGYITAQVNSTKKLKKEDIIKFSWDGEITKGDTSISKEDVDRLKNKKQEYLKYIRNGK
jgi:hypothetical protein